LTVRPWRVAGHHPTRMMLDRGTISQPEFDEMKREALAA
jgi:hypothetical protein